MDCQFANKTITVEIGKFAKQANGSVMIRCGDTAVLVTAVMSKQPKEGQSFFPLTVDYQEKLYAAGRIPGGFFKREARPSSQATLTARLIDRPIRPLFPKGFYYDVHIVATSLSFDGENEPDVLAQIGASIALEISDIPFSGPVAAVRVGRIQGNLVINPSQLQLLDSDLELLVSGTRSAIAMVEGSAKIVPEAEILDAIFYAHREMQTLIDFQLQIKEKFGKQKMVFEPVPEDETLKQEIENLSKTKFSQVMHLNEKKLRNDSISNLKAEVIEKATERYAQDQQALKKREAEGFFEELKENYARLFTLKEKKRIDGRGYDAIRTITCEVGLLPRVHGSSLFTRGETQSLAVVTLGTAEDQQRIEALAGESLQSFMLHYNFPPFSVGEVGFMRGPGRREIGHGALAQRALEAVLPKKEVFPYTIRVVSEILESNGSSSMASVCAGTLALMDAGIPISAPVAGIAMGLIKENKDVAVLSDILGDEDGFGDMDFKVTGTQEGVTALQMDIKIEGISEEILRQALSQAKEGRLFILSKMKEAIAESRASISPHAPRIHQMTIDKEKIRDVIGSGGKVIRGIIETTGVKIDIDDTGLINISALNEEAIQKAIKIIKDIVTDPQIGEVYPGKVIKVVDFGAFVEILPGKEGLVHISELAYERVNRVTDILNEGDTVEVKVIEIDGQGKIRLSRRALLPVPPGREGEASNRDEYRSRRPDAERSSSHRQRGGFSRPGHHRDRGGRGSGGRGGSDRY